MQESGFNSTTEASECSSRPLTAKVCIHVIIINFCYAYFFHFSKEPPPNLFLSHENTPTNLSKTMTNLFLKLARILKAVVKHLQHLIQKQVICICVDTAKYNILTCSLLNSVFII